MHDDHDDTPRSPLDVSPFRWRRYQARLRGWWRDYVSVLRFYTRIPVPDGLGGEHDVPAFARAARAVPLVGLTLGLLALLLMAVLNWLGVTPWLLAIITVAALVALTGAFHEDGLADAADGLGGGHTRHQKLEIMRDSRLGSYGALALMLITLVRIAALAALLAELTVLRAGLLLLAAETLSRTSALAIGAFLPAAREDGAGFAAGRPTRAALQSAAVVCLIVVVLTVWSALGFIASLLFILASLAGTTLMGWLAERQLGGQTGDIAGAAQQLNLVAMLALASIFV